MNTIFKTDQTELSIEEPFMDYFVFNLHTYCVFSEKNVEIDFVLSKEELKGFVKSLQQVIDNKFENEML